MFHRHSFCWQAMTENNTKTTHAMTAAELANASHEVWSCSDTGYNIRLYQMRPGSGVQSVRERPLACSVRLMHSAERLGPNTWAP